MESQSKSTSSSSSAARSFIINNDSILPELKEELELSVMGLKQQKQPCPSPEKEIVWVDPSIMEEKFSHIVFYYETLFDKPTHEFQQTTFLEFAIDQLLISLQLVRDHIVHLSQEQQDKSVKGESSSSIHLQPVQILCERLFLRSWNTRRDFDNFANADPKHRALYECTGAFMKLIHGFMRICESHEWISKRLISSFLLGVDQFTADPIAKLCFLYEPSSPESSAAMILLQPIDTFLSPPSRWFKSIVRNIPFKVKIENLSFWSNWAHYVLQASTSKSTRIWNEFIQAYSKLCTTHDVSSIASTLIIPATICLVAIAKQQQRHSQTASSIKLQVEQLGVFQHVLGLLESLNMDVRVCGGIAAIVLRDLLDSTLVSKDSDKQLQFEFGSISNQPLYKKLELFYQSSDGSINVNEPSTVDTQEDPEHQEHEPEPKAEPTTLKHIQPTEGSVSKIYQGMDLTFIAKIKAWDLSTYNEILEVFIDPSKDLSEAQLYLIRKKALLRLSVLISSGYMLDSGLGSRFTRIIAEHGVRGPDFYLPFILALYNLTTSAPAPVLSTLGQMCFDGIHYSLGQRFYFLNLYDELVQILSGKKCINCFKASEDQVQDWKELDMAFYKYFVQELTKIKKCFVCRKSTSTVTTAVSTNLAPTNTKNSKTRRFASPRLKMQDLILDTYSATYASPLWSSIANNLIKFPETNRMTMTGLVVTNLSLAMHLLLEIIQGTSASSPFVISIGAQITDLLTTFIFHESVELRLSTLRLLAIYLNHTKGSSQALSSLNSRLQLFQYLEKFERIEKDPQVRHLVNKILQFSRLTDVDQLGFNLLQGLAAY